jgi:formamidopyrimidine-DNA glycosylase
MHTGFHGRSALCRRVCFYDRGAMPELPEVEITRRSFAEALEGATVTGVQLGKPLRWPLGVPIEGLVGATLGLAQRRAKYLWLPMSSPDGGLLMHLGMSGSLALGPERMLGPHQHFALHTTRGSLVLTDPRRFGAVVWSGGLEVDPALKLTQHLGAEPFDPDLTAGVLRATWRSRKTPIKQLLLAGEGVVGAGNIYACEALWRAGIRPSTPGTRLSEARCGRLLEAVRSVLGQALAMGGSTLRDFSDAHGVAGAYQTQAAVYDREGQACPRCSAPIQRTVQAQRSTYFCARCQRP